MNNIKELKFQVWRLNELNKKLENKLLRRNVLIKDLKITIKELIDLAEDKYPFNHWGESNIKEYLKDTKKEYLNCYKTKKG